MIADTLKHFVGHKMRFYGIDDTRFKLENFIFEAIEDENDGYRSMLEAIRISVFEKNDKPIFFSRPLAYVQVVEHDMFVGDGLYNFCGYMLIDIETNYCWLTIGTDNTDDYYPSFVFNYSPDGKRKEFVE